MALALVLVPLLLAPAAYAVPSDRWRPWLLPLGGLAHLALTVRALGEPTVEGLDGWLLLDPVGKVFLGAVSVLFFLCVLSVPAYLAARPGRPGRTLCACLLLTLSMMTVVILSRHLGLLWVAMEAATLATAPCIYFNQNAHSLEATWKYLLICSVGIALALLGTFFLAYAALESRAQTSLALDDLVTMARETPGLSRPWLHAAFALLLVGYGTKMGLAPTHTWKPDAYGEAPGLVGALLAGGVTSCAFLAILRCYQVCVAAGDGEFAREMLLFVGLLSMAFGAAFLVRQRDFKRMLAYSSVEHMGILVIGIGLGGLAVYGALLHLINNALTKGVLFLSAGNIHRAYGSKRTDQVRGALRVLPLSATTFLAGFFAITGSPPFGPFLSEFTIVSAAFADSRFWVGGLFLVLLAVVFVGMGTTVLAVVQGEPAVPLPAGHFRDGPGTAVSLLTLLALVLLLGVYIPPPLEQLLREAAAAVELRP